MSNEREQTVPCCLVAVMGLPGAGKSAAAHLIAQRLDAVLLRSDVIRKEIFPIPRYTPEEGRHIYQVMFERAAEWLAHGQPVVLDATFRSDTLRRQVQQIADAAGICWRLVWVTAPEEMVRARLSARQNDPSDADFETYQHLRMEFEPVSLPHAVVDNTGSLAELADRVNGLFSVG